MKCLRLPSQGLCGHLNQGELVWFLLLHLLALGYGTIYFPSLNLSFLLLNEDYIHFAWEIMNIYKEIMIVNEILDI